MRRKRAEPGALEKQRAYQRRRYRENPEYRSKKIARSAALRAFYAGVIPERPCEKCGAGWRECDMHHDDYSKPLDVRFLCRPCHLAEHEKR